MIPHRDMHRQQDGFTLVEIMVAAAIALTVITSVMTLFIHSLHVWERESIVGELNMDLELALERMRSDMRLSSVGIGLMSFYPEGGANFTALSLPLADDVDDDGLLDRDADGRIAWNRTVIYHVRPGTPDKLLRTEFWPRSSSATPEEIYKQLVKVVESTSESAIANAEMSGEQSRSRVVFENLVDLTFYPPDARYDCYAAVRGKGRTFNWGSVVLDKGMHTLRLEVVGKNVASSGYNVEIDRVRMSNTASSREGEIFVPKNTHPTSPYFDYNVSGATVSGAQRGSGWAFSGNGAMVVNAATTGAVIELNLYNDLWCDSNFNNPGGVLASNCSVKFDHSFTNIAPFMPDVVVSMDRGVAWTANSVSDSSASSLLVGDTLTVTNILYSGTNAIGGITLNGKWARVSFQGGIGASTYITNAMIADAASGGASNITFNGGASYAFVPARTILWSDWVPEFTVSRDRSYHVSFRVGGVGDLDLDLFVGGYNGRLLYRQNIGTPMVPSWGASDAFWQGVDYGSYSGIAFVDIDADGDLDLFIGGWSVGEIKFYENRGTVSAPNMVLKNGDWNGIRHPLSRPAFADIDADGDYDCFIGGQNGRLQFLRNTGTPSAPSWAAVDPSWMGLRVLENDNPFLSNHYTAPAFADIDADGDLDLFVGRYAPGNMVMFENTGTAAAPAFGVTNNPYAGLNVGLSCTPAFGDIDGDGDLDLLSGDINGTVTLFINTGTPAAAVWGITNANFNGIDTDTWSTPVFANINPDLNSLWRELAATNIVAYTNGVASSEMIAISQLEVGYPETAIYRSGIFDTLMDQPAYNKLNWTHVEDFAAGGDVDIRVRSSDLSDMSDLTDADWQDARFGDDGYFQSNIGNNLVSLPKCRYVQYEALFRCFKPAAHIAPATAILRDVTIEWPGPTGLVDLLVDFGKGPDCGIVTATVDGRSFMKGVTLDMEIFKKGRTGLYSASGTLEVRPLNTGK